VGNRSIKNIFLLAFLIPYIAIFILSGAFIYNAQEKIQELKKLIELTYPVESLSKLITLLNREKVFRVVQWEEGNRYDYLLAEHKEFLQKELSLLVHYLKRESVWRQYCTCREIFLLDEELQRLERKRYTSIKELLLAYDRLINQLCSYYTQLSSALRLKFIALQFKTLYTLHKFHTATADLVAEYFSFLEGRNPYFDYSFYYYYGEIGAYADTYYALIDFPKPKEKFKGKVFHGPLLERLIQRVYNSNGELLEDFVHFEHTFWRYKNDLLTLMENQIQRIFNRYEFQLFEVILLAVLSFLSLLALNFILYQYGASKFEELLRKVEMKTLKDPLTGLFNRRFFNLYLVRKLKETSEGGQPVSFILLDLDNFKKINDTYGHAFGDKVLRHVARILRKSIRKEDIALRWGGEEFGVFVKAPLEDAKKLAERIRKRLEESPVDGVKITASFGVGEYRGEDPKEFFQKVDQALYRAKKMGKNRVETAE